MAKCEIGYEVSVVQSVLKTRRSVVFISRTKARDFQRRLPGATLTAVELCDGKIKRRGKQSYASPLIQSNAASSRSGWLTKPPKRKRRR